MPIIYNWFQISFLCLFGFLFLASGAHAVDCPYQGNWSGIYQETSCDNSYYSERWEGTVDANCFFYGADGGFLSGTINPATGHVSLVGHESGCGTLTGTADFVGASVTGTFGGSGVIGSFSGNGSYTPTCNFSLSPTSASFVSTGGAATINISAPSGCSWSASENISWLTFTSATSGSGTGSVHYTVSENTSSLNRSATITVAGKSFVVNQRGVSCSYSLSPTSASFVSTGGAATINISAPSGCSWSASKNVSWLTFTSATSGSGNGFVHYTVAANTSSDRSATITIAGKSFTVSQERAVNSGAMTAIMSLLLNNRNN